MPQALQLATVLLQLYFAAAEAANLNEEQKEALYKSEEEKFKARDPEQLIAF